ncbi:MAG: allantoin permease [Glaciimonas sp.]|nr:allantoin permease [Glaciimonas sp.]
MALNTAQPANPANPTNPANPALIPIPLSERVFGFREHASLWFSLGVGLLVMQVGAYLVPAMGTQSALLAIVIGSLLGAGLLGWVALIGCERGLSSPALMHQTLGTAFAKLPVILNIVQLVGWTAFELVIMRDSSTALIKESTGVQAAWVPVLTSIFWGLLLVGLANGSMISLVRRFVGRFGLPLVVLSLLWLTYQFGIRAHSQGLAALWNKAGDGSMSTIAAIDLVMAMPVSWLPLVADFARYGKTGPATVRGTWVGYTIANIWCYALGVLVISTTAPGVELVGALLLAQGGLVALGLILIDEMDNAYGDVYSGAVSLNFIGSHFSVKTWGITLALVATGCAIVLPMHSLEPFLLLLSSIFVPLFGVVISQLTMQGRAAQHSINTVPVLIWLLGITAFHAAPRLVPEIGSALPSLALTLLLGTLYRFSQRRRVGATHAV